MRGRFVFEDVATLAIGIYRLLGFAISAVDWLAVVLGRKTGPLWGQACFEV